MALNNGSYEIKVDNAKKTVNLYVSGSAKPEAIQDYLNEFNSIVNKIQVSEFDLIADCQEMSVETPDKVDKMVGVIKMYQQSGFKKIILKVAASNTILKMQLKRVVRTSGVGNIELLEV